MTDDDKAVGICAEDRLEPDVLGVDPLALRLSIAISLKRIADTLERANLNGDHLANAIEGAIYRGLQGGGRT